MSQGVFPRGATSRGAGLRNRRMNPPRRSLPGGIFLCYPMRGCQRGEVTLRLRPLRSRIYTGRVALLTLPCNPIKEALGSSRGDSSQAIQLSRIQGATGGTMLETREVKTAIRRSVRHVIPRSVGDVSLKAPPVRRRSLSPNEIPSLYKRGTDRKNEKGRCLAPVARGLFGIFVSASD